MTIEDIKARARKQAFAARKDAHAALRCNDNTHLLAKALSPYQGAVLAAYMPIRTEINPLPFMEKWAQCAPVCVPVIRAAAAPLVFSQWHSDGEMIDGPFGARIPKEEKLLIPDVVIVPLVAFDENGGRLGYGGGFYDRTLEKLRANGRCIAIGFAYDAQQQDQLPLEDTDQPLDMIVTETRILTANSAD